MPDRIWTVSNCLSILRMLLAVPVALLLLADTPEKRGVALGIIVIAILTDYLDGWFARKKGEITEFGKFIDPFADKLGLGITGAVLVVLGRIPLWFLVVLVVRDLLILGGAGYIMRTRQMTTVSNVTGKWAVFAISLYVLISIFPAGTLAGVRDVLMYLSLVMMIVSLAVYAVRLVKILRTIPRSAGA